MQPVSCMGCSKRPWRQAFQMYVHVFDLALRQCRLQADIRGAFEKLQGTVARVHIGQVIMSICNKLQNKEHVIESLLRAKFKFPGCQKIHISKKWGFTKFTADEFEDMVAEKRLIADDCGVKYIPIMALWTSGVPCPRKGFHCAAPS
nr:60S ribosomal protein L10-like [Pan troglodytes]